MPEHSELSVHDLRASSIVHDVLNVLLLLGERVAGEGFQLTERLAIRTDSAPGKVERHRRQSALRERLRQVGEESPVRKPLEPVTYEHRASRRLGSINLAANEQTVRAGDLERLRTRLFRRAHPSTSPLMSAQPRKPRAIDATLSYPICFIVSAASADR